jgi:hypothetical protein
MRWSFKLSLLCCCLLLVSLYSCKEEGSTANPNIIPVVWGRLSAIMQENKVISGTDTVTTISQLAMAGFIASPSAPNSYTDAGKVTVNNIELIKNASNNYLVQASAGQTPADLEIGNKIEWHVAGSGNIPGVFYADAAAFPTYLPSLPYEITKANGLTFTLDSTTVTGADSVRVLIDDASGNMVQSTFSAGAGSVTIPASSLSVLSNVSDQTAAIAIMPYIGTVKAFQNKGMYFIRERRLFQSININ